MMNQEDDLWYKDAIVYQTHVKAFYDSDGDGIGDLKGLTSKLDYVKDLGVNTLWLLPFYPSPMKDDGYDIADYRNIAPQYGTTADFKRFVKEAHARDIRVITELVINHTSDQHPWFQAARRAPKGSKKRNFYVWSDDPHKFSETRIIFTDTERSNWAWDEVAEQFYWHRFFSHQPDLNHNNPEVVKAVLHVMRYWFDMGVDGMRLDAIPYLCVREGTNNENLPETHDVLKQMRAELDKHYKGRMFLAEANQWPEDVREYFGDGDECHMAYHFPLMPRMYMAVAQEDRHPIVEIMRQTPEIPDNCQWAIFLRNHDELTLEMVTDSERDYMYSMYAADPRARVNVGIRRRLAPLMDNNRGKIELMTSMLMTMPGSPILYYGDELGMGDNIYLGDRNGVRTPMQWSPDRNAGFSQTDPQKLFLPAIMDPVYGYESVNVESAGRSPSSLLNWTKRLIAVRKSYKAFGRGSLEFFEPGNRKILAYLRRYEDEVILCVANLAHSAQPVELDLSEYRGMVPVELMARTPFPPIGDSPYLFTLQPYGFYAFRLASDVDMPAWHKEHLPQPELPVMVLLEGWSTFGELSESSQVRQMMAARTREQLGKRVLAPYISSRRWYARKGAKIEKARLRNEGGWPVLFDNWLLGMVDITTADDETQSYFLPLGIVWEKEKDSRSLAPWALARVRQRENEGLLYGALGEDAFCRKLLHAIRDRHELPAGKGVLRFTPTAAFEPIVGDADAGEIRHPSMEQSNTSVFFGDKAVLKVYRRVQEGLNPELEMGQFLTEVVPFAHIAAVAGSVEWEDPQGQRFTLAILQAFVQNQGDAWQHTMDYLERDLFDVEGEMVSLTEAEAKEVHAANLILMESLGLRVGQMHKALATETGNAAFDPEPMTGTDMTVWLDRIREEADRTLAMLDQQRSQLPEDVRLLADSLAENRQSLMDRIAAAGDIEPTFSKTRYHGDLHLGQVLLAENDFKIADFEGEPARPMRDRRTKGLVLRDVAGMLRSFDYAAVSMLRKMTVDRPNMLDTLKPRTLQWQQLASDAFLRGYRGGAADAASLPSDPEQMRRLLELCLIEKALYEVRYELDNRPDWIGLPLSGILQLVGTPLS